MTKTMLMVSHKNYNLSVDEGFVLYPTSKLITRFIEGFTLGMKSQSISYILNESEHIHWILDLEGESALKMGFVDKWPSKMQGQWFFRSRTSGQKFSIRSRKPGFLFGVARIYLPKRSSWGGGLFNIHPIQFIHL